jgi:hypothetical protein
MTSDLKIDYIGGFREDLKLIQLIRARLSDSLGLHIISEELTAMDWRILDELEPLVSEYRFECSS